MFIPHVQHVRMRNGAQEQTALLFYDGHASHISIRIIEGALENNIQIIKFPSHLTDRLQPLDKCVFGPVKQTWERLLVNNGKRKIGRCHTHLTKQEFSALIGQLWPKISTSNIISGFRTTGLFPLDSEKIPNDLFAKKHLERYLRERNMEKPSANRVVNENQAVTENQASTESQAAVSNESQLVQIFFGSSIKQEPMEATNEPRALGTRLKHHTYGEVLTSGDVLSRLKIAEDKKTKKGSCAKVKKVKVEDKKAKPQTKKRKVS